MSYHRKPSRPSLLGDDDIYSEFNIVDNEEIMVPVYTPSNETLLDGRNRHLPASKTSLNQFSGDTTPLTKRTSSLVGVNCNNTNNGWSALSARSGSSHMTSVRAAGYTSGQNGSAGFRCGSTTTRGIMSANGGVILSSHTSVICSPLEINNDNSVEMQHRKLLKQINEDLSASCIANAKGDFAEALQKAKDASMANKRMVRLKHSSIRGCFAALPNDCKFGQTPHGSQIDVTFAVQSNLAMQYEANRMYREAVNEYETLSRNKNFLFAGHLRVNIGNIYFKNHEYQAAIKNYMMALDQVPTIYMRLKDKIMHNVAISFFKMKSYEEALRMFEGIMSSNESARTAFNIILCHSALGQVESMKTEFIQLLKIDPTNDTDDDQRYVPLPDDKPHQLLLEVIRNDELRRIENTQKNEAEAFIMQSVRFIAAQPSCYGASYDWCIDQVKGSEYTNLIVSLEVDKAIGYIRQNDFPQAVNTINSLDIHKNTVMSAKAATNLSFIYSLTNDGLGGSNGSRAADHYADMALQADHYNASALVNKGNVYYGRGDFEKAHEYYRMALQFDAECLESVYNLGLANKKLKRYEDALGCFNKFCANLGTSPQIVYHFADIRELMGSREKAMELFVLLIGMVPSDAGVLRRIGQAYADAEDRSSALLYYTDAYHFDPNNAAVIEWLGTYYLQSQYMEQAIKFFQKGALVEPNNITWKLMTASCLRRCGNIQLAYEAYRNTHRRFPDNIECLRFLVRLGTDMNLAETKPYAQKLKRALNVEKLIRESKGGKGQFEDEESYRQTSAGSGRKEKLDSSKFKNESYNGIKDSAVDDHASRERVRYEMEEGKGERGEMCSPKAMAKGFRRMDVFDNETIGDDLLPD